MTNGPSHHHASRRAPVPQHHHSNAGPSTGDRRKRMSTTSGSSSGREDARSIGQWRIGRTIGKGSSGTCVRCRIDSRRALFRGSQTADRTSRTWSVQDLPAQVVVLAATLSVARSCSVRGLALRVVHHANTDEIQWADADPQGVSRSLNIKQRVSMPRSRSCPRASSSRHGCR